MTNAHTFAVLGLGRMGSAMASRLAAQGGRVTGWSRRSAAPEGVPAADEPGKAVRDADIVLLALFDGPACTDVLAACLDDLRPDCLVVNTSTVSAAEAVAIERTVVERGHRYLHCPVLGSVPAVEAGTLTLLAGAESGPEPLAVLGRFLPCGDTATAATAKLVANSVLASSAVALGEAVARGLRTGLDRTLLLDLLGRTSLGPLTTAKAAWLTGGEAPARFTTAALTKDVELLCAADPLTRPLSAAFRAPGTPPDTDMGAVIAALGERGTWALDPASHLDAAPTVPRDPAPLAPLIAYARGHATGDPTHFRTAFLPTAHVEGIREGEFVSWDLERYTQNFRGTPAADEDTRTRTVTALDRQGTIATATMALYHGETTFIDMFVLIEHEGTWYIANKVYHRESTPA